MVEPTVSYLIIYLLMYNTFKVAFSVGIYFYPTIFSLRLKVAFYLPNTILFIVLFEMALND